MRRGRPSRTSSLVTLMRALAHEGVTEVRDFSDPTAMAMLPPSWRLVARLALRRLKRTGPGNIYWKDGLFDLIALRTRVFDDAWDVAHATGVRQLVLLGAGLDGRAFRLPDIGDTAVFEIDHPATQALKRERARGMSGRAQRHRFVPVDFERDRLDEALIAAGFCADQPAFWIWEGVTAYLTRAAQKATLDSVARCTLAGSRIAATYIEPDRGTGLVTRTRWLVGLLGEPFRGLMTREEAADLLRSSGFSVVEDSGMDDWRRRFTDRPGRPDRPAGRFHERIVIGERNG